MNAGSSKILSSNPSEAPKNEEYIETLATFEARISEAQMAGDEWIETTDEILKFFNRKGMNGAKYFVYKGIKVCLKGEREEIEKECDEPLSRKLFGSSEGTVNGR